MCSTYACPQSKRIQGSGTPIGNTHQQKNKGDQRVQKAGHHVTDCSAEYTRINKHTAFSHCGSSANILVLLPSTPVGKYARCFPQHRLDSLAGLLEESNGNEDSAPQEDDSEENDGLGNRYDDHYSRKKNTHTHTLRDYLLHTTITFDQRRFSQDSQKASQVSWTCR